MTMPTPAEPPSLARRPPGDRVLRPLVARALRDARGRTIGFAYLFAAVAYLQPVAYRHAYATLAERIAFARSFGANQAVVLFYGKSYDLLTVGGYTAWRVGGTLVIMASVFGLLAGVRALRAEEEAGRTELLLSGSVTRATLYAAALLGIAGQAIVLWAATLAGLLLGGLPAGPSAYLAVAIASPIPVLAGVGALTSQLAPSRRLALEFGGLVVGLSFALRVCADTTGGVAWLRWLTPMGWAEELRPFTGAHPAVLVLPGLVATALLIGAGAIAAQRDIGRGLISPPERRRPRLALLGSTTAQALREERLTLAVWVTALGALSLFFGVISASISTSNVPASLQHALERLGIGSSLTPRAYLAFCFSLVVLLVTLLAVGQVGAARREELEGRLSALLALPVDRRRWLLGRLGLGVAALLVAAMVAAILGWAGAVSQGQSIALSRMLEAGINCLPVALLFLGVSALAFSVAPQASGAIGYGLVLIAFLWQELGGLLGAPHWLVDATPFAHVGLVPVASIHLGAAATMTAIGLVAAGFAAALIEHRDALTP
jgi:ABC-2 type transport system permease protein